MFLVEWCYLVFGCLDVSFCWVFCGLLVYLFALVFVLFGLMLLFYFGRLFNCIFELVVLMCLYCCFVYFVWFNALFCLFWLTTWVAYCRYRLSFYWCLYIKMFCCCLDLFNVLFWCLIFIGLCIYVVCFNCVLCLNCLLFGCLVDNCYLLLY